MHLITLLRHGRSQADDEDRFEARYDSPLTDVGREQARSLVERWRDDPQRKYNLIISSPLKRASQTAEIISDALSMPVELDERWMEIDAGDLSGLPKDEGMKRFPPKSFQGPYDRIADGSGESEAQIHARALLAVESLINLSEERYLVISHGAFLNAVVRMAFGVPIPLNRKGVHFRFTDAGFMDLAYNRDNHRWLLLSFGCS
jgi:2,3-bisphosphoglycerate-dependent phosphoglycerate mutase